MHSSATSRSDQKRVILSMLCVQLLLLYSMSLSQTIQAQGVRSEHDARLAAPELLLHENGTPVSTPPEVAEQLEQMPLSGPWQQALTEKMTEILYTHYASGGHFSARIDSLSFRAHGDTLVVWSSPGCRYTFGNIVLKGIEELAENRTNLLHIFNDNTERFNVKLLEQKLLAMVTLLEREGYLLAHARLQAVEPRAETCEVDLVVQIEAGNRYSASGVHVSGLQRYDPEFVATATGIRNHMWLTPETFSRGRRNLLNTGFFREVSQGELLVTEQGGQAWYHVEEQPSNHFDFMLGYAPGQAGTHRIAGRADLGIRNVFWHGSLLEIYFEATDPGATKMNTGFGRQWIRGYPLGLGIRFDMIQQDSLYQNREWSARGSWDLNERNRVLVSVSRHITVAGTHPSEAVSAGNAVTHLIGTGYEFSTLDHPRRPRSGQLFGVQISYGFKRFENLSDEHVFQASMQRQQRLVSRLHVYRNPWRRHVVALRAEGLLLESGLYAESDLFRLGGAASVRGYREDRFRAGRAVWYDAEHRYLLDQDAHAFLFVASGHLHTPSIPGRYQAQNQWLFSAGFGFRYEISLGLMQFTYAVSREDPVYNGKVHIQLTAGF